MSTILTLTPDQQTRLDHVAQVLGREPTTLLQEHFHDLVEDLLEDLSDLAEVQKRRQALATGNAQRIDWSTAREELLGMEDMQGISESE